MPLTIQVPQVGLTNATEEPKLANDMTNLATWANGNISDADLRSSNNQVRRLILQATGTVDDSTPAGDLVFCYDGYPAQSGAAVYVPPPLWIGDSGVSSQPPDFQVPNKTAVARVRAALAVSASAPVAINAGLYQITGVGGTARAVSYTFATAFPGSAVQVVSPAAGIVSLESLEFSLPTAAAVYALGVNLSAPLPSGCAIAVTCQLYAYSV